jgi:hypothetical protein
LEVAALKYETGLGAVPLLLKQNFELVGLVEHRFETARNYPCDAGVGFLLHPVRHNLAHLYGFRCVQG